MSLSKLLVIIGNKKNVTTNNNEFSAAAHLIHSRLQLIRRRLNVFDLQDPFYLLKYNSYYFNKAAELVLRNNHFSSERKDILQAAELFLLSLDKLSSLRGA